MPTDEHFLGIKALRRRDVIGMGVAVAVAAVIFGIWATRTESKIITYTGASTWKVDKAVSDGWRIEDTQVTRQSGTLIDGVYFGDDTVTTVTLERSNWSKMWND
jgi:hypothetical protein